jgi:RNA processing factor Prp31
VLSFPCAQVLGAKRKNLAGFSSTAAQPHQGFIFASDIVQQTPPSLRSKAARLVGAKCTLLARIDAYGQVRGSWLLVQAASGRRWQGGTHVAELCLREGS